MKLRRHQRVTVVRDKLLRARVMGPVVTTVTRWQYRPEAPRFEVQLCDSGARSWLIEDEEGSSWCRGWRGQAVDALRAVQALATTPSDSPLSDVARMLNSAYRRYQKLPAHQKAALATGAVLIAEALVTLAEPTKPTT